MEVTLTTSALYEKSNSMGSGSMDTSLKLKGIDGREWGVYSSPKLSKPYHPEDE